MAKKLKTRKAKLRVDIWSILENHTAAHRPACYDAANQGVLAYLDQLYSSREVNFRSVFVDPVEKRAARDTLPGFRYVLKRSSSTNELWLYVSLLRSKARQLTDKQLTQDFVAATKLMIDRVRWQERQGTLRENEPRWKERPLSKSTAFPGLAKSQRGEVYWEMLPGGGRSQYECEVHCPRFPEQEMPKLVKDLETLLDKQGSLQLDDIGYVVPTRTAELFLVGKRSALERFVPTLRSVFKGRTGAVARIRPAMSEAKGKACKLS